MTLLEYYLNVGSTGTFGPFSLLNVTQWKYKFVSAAVFATGSSTVDTTTKLSFLNALQGAIAAGITYTTSSTTTSSGAQQYPAGNLNNYFSPLVGNTLEQITGYVQNATSLAGNYLLFALEISLDGDFDE